MYVHCICMHEYLYHIMDIQKHNSKFGGFIETFLVNVELVNFCIYHMAYFYVTCIGGCHSHGHNSPCLSSSDMRSPNLGPQPMKTKRARYCVGFLLKPLVFLALGNGAKGHREMPPSSEILF